ncbi:MAG: hypothetical protein ACOYBL_09680 [Lachnospiraceae bacterium]|jgi:hypothetical protein
MKLFGKKREKDRRINQDNLSVEIPVYGPHDTLCAQDYKLPYMLSTFEQNFEQRCKTWLQNAKPDMYNRGYMDLLIDQLEREAVIMLDIQEVDHQSAIFELAKIWTGDQIKAKTKLENTEAERMAVEKEIRQLEGIYYRGTAYEAWDENVFESKEGDVSE